MAKGADKDSKHNPASQTTTRRAALKRIAAAISGVAVGGAGLLGKASEALGQHGAQVAQRYISIGGSYVDWVYVSGYTSYNRYMSYYTSYRSHYSSVPPPYSSRYSSAR